MKSRFLISKMKKPILFFSKVTRVFALSKI